MFTGEQLLNSIRQDLSSSTKPNSNFKLSNNVTLESCIMALDLESTAMDRGMIIVDGLSLWQWRDQVFRNLPAKCTLIKPDDFAVRAMRIVLYWLLHDHVLAQDSLMCILPMVRPDLSGPLRPVVKALWFIITHACQEVSSVGFDKDERQLSRHFYNINFEQYEPRITGIAWLDLVQEALFAHHYLSRPLPDYDHIPGECKLLTDPDVTFDGLIEPQLSNIYGIGCPRRSKHLHECPEFSSLLHNLNHQLSVMRFAMECFRSGTCRIAVLRELIKNCLDDQISCQFVRAVLWNVLTAYHLSPNASFWKRINVTESDYKRAYTDLVKILLHAKERRHRLLRDFILKRTGCFVLEKTLIDYVKVYWIELGSKLDLYNEREQEEALVLINHIRSGTSTDLPNSRRWSCLHVADT